MTMQPKFFCNCSRTNSWQRVTTERESDGVDDADASSSRSFDDGSDVGVEVCAPSGAETVRDFAKDDARSQRLLGAVVGRWDVAIGDEDKQVLAEALDDPLELLPRLSGGQDFEQRIEAGLETCVVGGQGRVSQCLAPPANPNGTLQQAFYAGRESDVARVDGVLNVAEQMGEAGLIVRPPPSPLVVETIGTPELGTDVAEKLPDHRLAA